MRSLSSLARWKFNLLLFLLLLSSAPVLSQGREAPNQDRETTGRDGFNEIIMVKLENGETTEVTREPAPPPLPPGSFVPEPKPHEDTPSRPARKISPDLLEKVEKGNPDKRELVLIKFRDTIKIPRLPRLAADEPRTSPRNQDALQRRADMINTIKSRRGEAHLRRIAELSSEFGIEHIESFWLVDGMLVRVPLGAVKGLAQRPDVAYVEAKDSDVGPPLGDGNALNDVIDARTLIQSDPYFNTGLAGGFIGLIDTGVRSTHVQFNNPSHLGYRRDCVNATDNQCTTGTNLNPGDCGNHGTKSAAVLTANTIQGNDYRGVTEITVDSFRVYKFDTTQNGCVLDRAAATRAFQAALSAGDGVIVAQIQDYADEANYISDAADKAFDAGTVVIAANGNYYPDKVRSPAIAHKVIGVGAVNVQTLAIYPYQSRGPALDGRIKPDIQAPTDTETASSASDTALTTFTGTSGSTPYAAGAAALFSNWLANQMDSVAPGQVYAYMILAGQNPSFNNDSGAGLIKMPVNGATWRGSVAISNGQTYDIPLSVSGTFSRLDGALWWPEGQTQPHNDLDLYLISPSGSIAALSTSIPSVFERARATGTVTGNWTLRIQGAAVSASPQTVYWAAYVH